MKNFKHFLAEKSEPTLVVTIPLLIRALEWAREDAKTDVEVHNFVENMTKKSGTISTADYPDLIK